MGLAISKSKRIAPGAAKPLLPHIERQPTRWKIIPGMQELQSRYMVEGTLPDESNPQMVELRALLDDPIGQRYLGKFAQTNMTREAFFGWIDINEFKDIPTADYRRGKAMHIYQKYIRENAVLQIGGCPVEERERIGQLIDSYKADRTAVVPPDLFKNVQMICFKEMYINTYQAFKKSELYTEMKSSVRNTYNKVTMTDFDYLELLGEGGFGKVLHVRKKSTGRHYAMKIQLKTALLDTFSDDFTRIDNERRVFAATHHPFIVGMDYAFQTESLAVMVLDLVTGGDLQGAIDASKEGRLDELRVQFYAAEITLALAHLHDLGLMYRDLKPCNVMLCGDGHVKLADMGGVAEFADGTCLDVPPQAVDKAGASLYAVEIGALPKFQQARESTSNNAEDGDQQAKLEGQHRRRSIMGTQGYMAPEMVILLNQPRSVRVGYSKAVDYWSLGVTIFKLLTGSRPFGRRKFEEFLEDTKCRMGQGFDKYQEMLEQAKFPSYLSEEARSVVVGLLDGNEHRRLGGSTREKLEELKNHSFFNGIDWSRMSQRHVIPPYLPRVKPLREDKMYPTFDDVLKEWKAKQATDDAYKDSYDWMQSPNKEDQKYFAAWDYVSMHTLKIEMGVANEMEVFDNSFKVRQLMGDAGRAAKVAAVGGAPAAGASR